MQSINGVYKYSRSHSSRNLGEKLAQPFARGIAIAVTVPAEIFLDVWEGDLRGDNLQRQVLRQPDSEAFVDRREVLGADDEHRQKREIRHHRADMTVMAA